MGMFTYVPAGANVWIGASDADSGHDIEDPMWLDETTITIDVPEAYDTSDGIAGCGYYAPAGSGDNNIKFGPCTSTSASTPSYYLCEYCP